ncbi:MAG: 2Fe-2S iron-sulfur cluster-binding protein, partial [Patescibacteria group bacterium]|nr:2Fe-2S iron-sulfur cluster-binding protein [Patescibacteria group bacterium]
MIQIHVNGRPVEAQPGEMLLAVLRRAGIRVPTLCHIDGLPPSGACRMCVVEVEGQRGLIPSCAAPVQDGMKVHTHTQRVAQARRTIVELLLANHPDDCLYCVRSGNCELRILAEELGVRRRYSGRPAARPLDVSSPAIRRHPDKCILCGKCVRVCEEVQGVAAIDFIGRGATSHVGTAFEEGLNVSSCVTCGQCVTICPTGALIEHDHTKEVLNALADPNRFVVVQ